MPLDLDDGAFVTSVEEIYELACRTGEAHAPLTEEELNGEAGAAKALTFFGACYDGFQAAQERIVTSLLGVESEQRETTRQLKEARRERNKESAGLLESTIRALNDRELILRSLANAIAWQSIGFDVELAQTLFAAGESAGPLSGTNHESLVTFSREFRRRNPHGFALINDITTLVRAADSLTIERQADGSPRLGVTEIKTGEKNFKIGEFARFAVASEMACPASFGFFAGEHGDKGVDQLLRVLGQAAAMARTAQRIVSPPTDNMNFGAPKSGPDVPVRFARYDHCLSDCIETAHRTSKPSVARYDGCLYIAASVSDDIDRSLDTLTSGCSTISTDLWQTFREPLALPVFVRSLARASIMQVTFGAVRARLRLDMGALGELGVARGLNVERLSRRETGELRPRISPQNTVDGRAVAFGRDGRRFVVGDGLITRIFFHGLTPEAALDFVEASLDGATPSAAKGAVTKS